MSETPKQDLIFQRKPIYSDDYSYRRKSWCDTVASYINQANAYSSLLVYNQRISNKHYRHMATICLLHNCPLKQQTRFFPGLSKLFDVMES